MTDWAQFHFEQSRSNSCVAACLCIVQKWRRESPSEAVFLAALGAAGDDVRERAKLLGDIECIAATTAGDLEPLLRMLQQQALVLVHVVPSLYVRWQRRKYPALSSKHGQLAKPTDLPRMPHHALVLIAYNPDTDEISLLDPWFPATDQPLLCISAEFDQFYAAVAVAAF